jgi:hypothetical protein
MSSGPAHLHSKFQANLGYIGRPYFKKKKKNKTKEEEEEKKNLTKPCIYSLRN